MEMFIEYRISMVFLLAFLLLLSPLRYKVPATIGIAAGCFIATAVFDGVYLLDPEMHPYIWVLTLAETLIVQATAFVVSRYRDFRALFNGFSAAAYVLFGNIASELVLGYTGSGTLAVIVQIAVHVAILAFFVAVIRERYLEDMKQSGIGWAQLCLLPALSYVLVYAVNSVPHADASVLLFPMLTIFALMIAGYTVITRIFSRQRLENRLARDNDLMESYAERVQREAEEYRESEAESALLRHDLRHYATLISGYLDAGETGKIRELLAQANDHLDSMTPLHFCENASINAIISSYWRTCKQNGIDFKVGAAIPASLAHLDDLELATVTANLLDNAVNAALQMPDAADRFVKIVIHKVKDQAFIEATNPYAVTPVFDEETGLPLSNKGEGHGVGTRSIAAFAQRHDAWLDYSAKDGICSVKLIVPMS